MFSKNRPTPQSTSNAKPEREKKRVPPSLQRSSEATSHSNTISTGRRCDLWEALLLGLACFYFVELLVLAGYSGRFFWGLFLSLKSGVPSMSAVPLYPTLIISSIVGGALLSMIVFSVARNGLEGIIKAAYFVNIGMNVLVSISIMASSGMGVASVFSVLLAILSIVMYFLCKQQIPLSAAILKTVLQDFERIFKLSRS